MPEQSERENWLVNPACLQLIILVVATLGAAGSYLVGIHGGREYPEQPLSVKFGRCHTPKRILPGNVLPDCLLERDRRWAPALDQRVS